MNDDLKQVFRSNLLKLIGKECWGIVNSAGSHISFDFGNKILRKKPVGNLTLPEDVNLNEAELSFLIFCVWRVESNEKVICGAWSETKETVNQLLNQKITDVSVEEPSFDLCLTFSNGWKLTVFCDSTNESDKNDNYDFFTPTEIFTVEMYSRLSSEPREITE